MPGATAAGELLVLGANHRTSPLAWRDAMALVESELPAALDRLAAAGLGEGVLLATCDRIELLTEGADAETVRRQFAAYLAGPLGEPAEKIAAMLYLHRGAAALRHLFAVASALDSLVVGEPQVLGQLRAAHRMAADAGRVGAYLESALEGAYAAARRVRRETRIAERPVSLAAAAVSLARDIHGELDRTTVLLAGAGEMGELIAQRLRQSGVQRFLIAAAGSGVQHLAERFGATQVALEGRALAEADIIVAAVGAGRRVLSAGAVEAALRERRRRPLFVIDAAIPPDVEPQVNDLDGAFLYTLDDLERVATAGRANRSAAAADAWAIVEAELEDFDRRRAERAAVPAVTLLRAHFEAMREEVLRQSPGLDAAAATRLLVNRLLHAPSEVLRGAGGSADEAAALVRRLFHLDGGEGDNES